jgi:hypothetical protein
MSIINNSALRVFSTTIVQAPEREAPLLPEEAEDWIKLYNRLPFQGKPNLQGTPLEQAYEMWNWLKPGGGGHASVLSCTELNLTDAELTTCPRLIGLFRNLQRLNLTDNQLTTIPSEIGGLVALQELDLSENQLTTIPPEMGGLVALTHLDLQKNQLTALPPEIGQLQALEQFLLQKNQFITLPTEIGRLLALQTLDLSKNQLVTMPDSLLHLSHDCQVLAKENLFDPTYLKPFWHRLTAHRLATPNEGPTIELDDDGKDAIDPIGERLEAWSEEFEETFPYNAENREHWASRTTDLTPLAELEGYEGYRFNKFLRRIREIPDYAVEEDEIDDEEERPECQRNVILRVERMVQLAALNPDFKKKMLEILETGENTCGDRVLILFNDIEVEWQLHCKEMTDEEFIPLAKRACLYKLLEQHAMIVAEQEGLHDEVETILGFHLSRLQEDFDLPISTEIMLYNDMSGVTEEMINQAQAILMSYSDEQLLERSTHWQERLSKRNVEEAQTVQKDCSDLLDAAQEYFSIEKPEERKIWLAHPENEPLRDFLAEEPVKSYDEAANAIMLAQNKKLARLGQNTRKRSSLPSSEDGSTMRNVRPKEA